MNNVTIKQIAEKAGVSTSAVSYVLNGKKGVSDETRDRILKIISEFNYIPNLNSRRLILQRSFNIILAINPSMSFLDDAFYTSMMKSIVRRSTELGYEIVLANYSEPFEESPLAVSLSKKNADGIVFLQDLSSALQIDIEKYNIPYIVVDSHRTNPSYPCIRFDYELGSYIATKHLISQGHTMIGFIGRSSVPDFYLRSFTGFQKAISEAKATVQMDWVQIEAYDAESAKKCMENILNSNQNPTAIFCSSDSFALGSMSYVQEKGHRIPQDFSFCSVDDIPMAKYYYPPLTTVHINEDEMGYYAVEVLDALITNSETKTNIIVNSDELVIRNSVQNLCD